MKKVAVYSPYLPKHMGGGERYLLSIAEVASLSADVTLLVPAADVETMRQKLPIFQSLFGLDLHRIHVQSTSIAPGHSVVDRLKETREYDVLFAMTDGSFFPSFAHQSYLIMQVPWMRSLSIVERVKLASWKNIIVYSPFVEKVLSKAWHTSAIKVVAPYVDTRDFRPVTVSKKEKLILNVGRFFSHAQSNSKRQDVLIEAFEKLLATYRWKGWHLALLGNVDPNPDSQAYLEKLRKLATGLSVSIHTDLSYDELRAFYGRASIYWHAAGYEVDEKTHPENTEHFGITTLEAMASGCIPFVVPKGGQPEIVGNERFYWNTIDELVEKSAICMHSLEKEQNSWQELSTTVSRQAERYSKSNFEQAVQSLL